MANVDARERADCMTAISGCRAPSDLPNPKREQMLRWIYKWLRFKQFSAIRISHMMVHFRCVVQPCCRRVSRLTKHINKIHVVFFFFFITGLTSFIMAAHIPAATGSMTVIECNWNSNWIADIRRGSNLAFLYNSITKLSHHFRTQTNKVEQQKKKKMLTGTLTPRPPEKKKKSVFHLRRSAPTKTGNFQVRVWVCVRVWLILV